MNAVPHRREDSEISSSMAIPKKDPKSHHARAPAGNKQVSRVSRKSQSHLKSDDSKLGEPRLLYANCEDLELSERKIQSQSKLSHMRIKSKTKVHTQHIVSPMDYTINEAPPASSYKPNTNMNFKVNSSSQNAINHE